MQVIMNIESNMVTSSKGRPNVSNWKKSKPPIPAGLPSTSRILRWENATLTYTIQI